MPAADDIVPVVAAVIERDDGTFLLAQRPAGKVYAGWWEFPGGKVEEGETLRHAVKRELREELGIEVRDADPWIVRQFTYPHATVRLHFFRIRRWEGEPHPHEGQAFAWCRAESVDVDPVLPANGPVFRALSLPVVYGITQAAELGVGLFLTRLDVALARGLRLVQVREKAMSGEQLASFARAVIERAQSAGAKVLINGDAGLARRVGADGVHLPAARLAHDGRPDLAWVGASCHDEAEVDAVVAAGADLLVLSPVLPTRTHPEAVTLGWERFGVSAARSPVPVFALGGMTPGLLPEAWQHGGHGIAMMRGAWE